MHNGNARAACLLTGVLDEHSPRTVVRNSSPVYAMANNVAVEQTCVVYAYSANK